MFENADLPYTAKHPILLDKTQHHTILMITDTPIRVGHNRVCEILIEAYSMLWEIGERSLMTAVLHCSIVCKLYEGKPLLASSPGSFAQAEKKEPGIHRLCMHQIFNNYSYRRDTRDTKY